MAISDLAGKVAAGLSGRAGGSRINSPDLQGLADELGVSVDFGGAATADPSDPPVYVRTGDRKSGVRGSEQKMSEVLRSFYRMSEPALTNLQARLINAGLLDPDDVLLGVHDEASFSAYAQVVERAAAFYDAGQQVTVDDILNKQGAGFLGWETDKKGNRSRRSSGGGGSGADADPQVIQLPDRRALVKIADAMSRTTTGRRLNPEQAEAIAAAYEQYLVGNQIHSDAVAAGGGTMRQGYSAEDFAEDQLRQQNPATAAARDEFNIVAQVMQGLGQIATGEEYGI